MKQLTYSSNQFNELNVARRTLWTCRLMLSEANKRNDTEGKRLWFGAMNRDRAELRKVAKRIRQSMPPRRKFRIVMVSPWTEFVVYEFGINAYEAERKANERYEGNFVAWKERTTEVIK